MNRPLTASTLLLACTTGGAAPGPTADIRPTRDLPTWELTQGP